MPTVATILELVAELPDESIDRAMAAALPTAGSDAVALMVPLLLRRMQGGGTVGLVHNFHILSYEQQAQVVQVASQLDRALRIAAGSGSNAARANAVEIISRARQLPLAYLVADQLRPARASLHEQAARCLGELAQYAWCEHSSRDSESCDLAARTQLGKAIVQAFEYMEHHGRAEIAEALLLCGSRAAAQAASKLTSATQPEAVMLRRRVAEPAGPRAVEGLYDWVTVKAVGDAAVTGIRHAAVGPQLAHLLTCSHRLLAEPVRAALGRLTRDKPLPLPTQSQLEGLPVAAQRGLARWIRAQSVSPVEKITALAQARTLSDPLARLSALRVLMELAGEGETGANEEIVAWCFDAEAIIARVAVRHLIDVRFEGLSRLLPQLAGATDPTVRQLAIEELSPTAFDKFWSAWPRLNAAQRLAAAQATVKIVANFTQRLTEKLRGDARERGRALRVIEQLDQAAIYERELLKLVASGDVHATSAAIRVLGRCDSIEAKAAVDRALAHADARVRANAVEALDRHLSQRHIAKLSMMAEREENRPRANAIRLLLRERSEEALRALAQMLADERPRHRTSALWLAGKMCVVQIAPQVAEMSLSDTDAQVRARAADTATALMQHMHTSPTLDPDFASAA